MSANAERAGEHIYCIYGLTISSQLELPEATRAAAAASSPDVAITLGQTPTSLPNGKRIAWWIEVEGPTCLMTFPGIGRIFAADGQRIALEKEPGATWDDLRVFLYGSGLGAVAHQRGLTPLHVSAVAAPGEGAIAFTGPSGSGKSTLAAALNQELDWSFVCDDVAVVRRADDGRFTLHAGVNTIKLWRDALTSLERSSEGLRRDLTRMEKFHAVQPQSFASETLILKKLVVLEWGDAFQLQRVEGRRSYQIALSAVYRPEMARLFLNHHNSAVTGMALAAELETYVLTRPRDHAALKQTARRAAVELVGQSGAAG